MRPRQVDHLRSRGEFLTELIESIGLKREQVYITNIVKDRPPENRDPTPEEIALYSPFLDRQVQIIQPKVIVTLGRYSMGYVMRRYDLDLELDAISKIHGHSFETVYFDADNKPQPVTIVTLYHPASALYNGGMRDTHKQDFEVLKSSCEQTDYPYTTKPYPLFRPPSGNPRYRV